MGIFKNYIRNSAIDRLTEERLYEAVAYEMDAGIIRKGLMTRAISETEGNEERANAKYIKLRVQSIIDENEVVNFLREMSEKYPIKGDEKKEENNYNEKEVVDYSLGGVFLFFLLFGVLLYWVLTLVDS